MLPEENQNIALSDRERLLEQAFYAIISLDEDAQKRVLSKYSGRYQWDEFKTV